MISSNINASSVNKVNAKVELYNGSTLVTTCTCDDRLQDFTVERKGQDSKFFGFGIIHKLTINFIDFNRELNITPDYSFKIYFGDGSEFVKPYPIFYAKEITRDETNNIVTVVAYDLLTRANEYTLEELGLNAPYTIGRLLSPLREMFGIDVNFYGRGSLPMMNYEGNYEGTEVVKDLLDDMAEMTQTIYFVNYNDKIKFIPLQKNAPYDVTITNEQYYSFETQDRCRLATITNTTELGDSASITDGEGCTQFVRNNPFWELREDIAEVLEEAMTVIGGITIAPFYCEWDGNFLLEPGSRIRIKTENDKNIVSYILNDTIIFDGTLNEITQWVYEADSEVASNPVSLGEKLKQTYARVDKQNKRIDIVASETADNKEQIAAIAVTTDEINLSVKDLSTKTETIETDLSTLNTDLTTLSGTVTTNTTEIGELKVTNNEISAKVTEVTTKTADLESSLGDTNAKVTENTTAIGDLTVTTESINASVSSLETVTTELTTKNGELESSITTNATAIGELQVSTESITASVSDLQTTTDNLTGEVSSNKENIAALQITTKGISTSVSTLETNVNSQIEGLDESFESLAKEVSTKVTAEDITVAIETERKNGATHVKTSTGFKFDSDGLTITKSDSEISTNIDEDGLSVFKHNEEVLTADNSGVKAKNLHATTYLIVGENTYFADYGNNRAGCFWTGK